METDDPLEPLVRLQLEVRIPEIVRLEPGYLFWGGPVSPEPKTSRVSIVEGVPGEFLGLTGSLSNFTARFIAGANGKEGMVVVTPLVASNVVMEKLMFEVRLPGGVIRRFPIVAAYAPPSVVVEP